MIEQEFAALADAELLALEAAVEAQAESCELELDVETKPGGILELEFFDGSKIIVNRHSAAREIWVAARSGGFHFACTAGRWIAGRDGSELWDVVARCIGEQGGAPFSLKRTSCGQIP